MRTENAGSSTTSYFSSTGDPLIDALSNGYVWVLDGNRTLDTAIADGFNREHWNDAAAVSDYLGLAGQIISLYADIKFNYSGYYINPRVAYESGAEITLSGDENYYFFDSSSTWGRAFFPNSANDFTAYLGAPGDVYINIASAGNFLPSYAPGSDGWFLLLHELGHALGLKHPHDDGGTGRPTFNELGAGLLDTQFMSIMSYNDSGDFNFYSWDPATPMILDVYALQYLYGKNNKSNIGDSSYSLTDDGYYVTLWDAAGTDTVNSSDSDVAWTIQLPTTSLSQLVDTRAGLAIPTRDLNALVPNTVVWLAGDYENATGSSYDDKISGNLFNNQLRGNSGNDVIDGDIGIDTALYSGFRSGYTLTKSPNVLTVADNVGVDGFDTLTNIERLQFRDKIVALDIDGISGKAYRIYQAAFARTPDNEGLKYWINTMDAGHSLEAVAGGFIASEEFKTLYGDNPSNEVFVTKLYNNVLGRAPEQEGFEYWVGLLNDQKISNFSTLINFSESNENQLNVIGVIENGIELFL